MDIKILMMITIVITAILIKMNIFKKNINICTLDNNGYQGTVTRKLKLKHLDFSTLLKV